MTVTIFCNILSLTSQRNSGETFSPQALSIMAEQAMSADREPIAVVASPYSLRVGHVNSAQVVDGVLAVVAEVRDDIGLLIHSKVATLAPCVTVVDADIVDGEVIRCKLDWLSVISVRGERLDEATP